MSKANAAVNANANIQTHYHWKLRYISGTIAFMRTIVTGTVGVDKIPYLQKVQALADKAGKDLVIFNVGERMYAEAPDVAPGRILDLPISRLSAIRRSVFKDILANAAKHDHIIVNTHATFRWKHGLFPAFDFDQLAKLNADMYITLMDTVDAVHARLERDHQIDHSLKDLLVWREEETLATEMMMAGCNWCRQTPTDNTLNNAAGNTPNDAAKFHILAVGENHSTAKMFARLIFNPQMPKAYLSFPITHVTDMPAILAEIDRFRHAVSKHLVVFDPCNLEEFQLYELAVAASRQARKTIELNVLGRQTRFDVAEVLQVAGDIHGQIYARDFKLVEQSDMIVSYIPELPNGKPGISSGVERELQHAHEAAKEVYVIWKPKVQPSPFVTQTATKIFPSIDHALDYFEQAGYIERPRRHDGFLFA